MEYKNDNVMDVVPFLLQAKRLIKTYGVVVPPLRYKMPNGDDKVTEADADYLMYTDASQKGYGAYLVDRGRPNQVAWIHREWEPVMASDCKKNSNLLEQYSLVESVFTWKKKFAGKRVLVKTDNTLNAAFVNFGQKSHKYSHSAHKKLFQVRQLIHCIPNIKHNEPRESEPSASVFDLYLDSKICKYILMFEIRKYNGSSLLGNIKSDFVMHNA